MHEKNASALIPQVSRSSLEAMRLFPMDILIKIITHDSLCNSKWRRMNHTSHNDRKPTIVSQMNSQFFHQRNQWGFLAFCIKLIFKQTILLLKCSHLPFNRRKVRNKIDQGGLTWYNRRLWERSFNRINQKESKVTTSAAVGFLQTNFTRHFDSLR